MSENPLLKASGTVADAGWGEKTTMSPAKTKTSETEDNIPLATPV